MTPMSSLPVSRRSCVSCSIDYPNRQQALPLNSHRRRKVPRRADPNLEVAKQEQCDAAARSNAGASASRLTRITQSEVRSHRSGVGSGLRSQSVGGDALVGGMILDA